MNRISRKIPWYEKMIELHTYDRYDRKKRVKSLKDYIYLSGKQSKTSWYNLERLYAYYPEVIDNRTNKYQLGD